MTASPSRLPVAAVVLTFNEAANLDRCLASVHGWCREIFVVDSGSTDGTQAIADRYGAAVVTHAFESHARQWQWALAELPIASPWVLALDADQRVSDELAQSIRTALAASGAVQGYFVPRRQVFRGRWIRHGGYYPKYLLKLFRRDAATLDPADRVDHHFRVAGEVARLSGDLIEDNRNEARIADWIARHNRYARLQAEEEVERLAGGSVRGRPFGDPDERVRWAKGVWRRLPLYVRSFLYFGYRYVLRLGFLDGKQGFIFHFMQALWYRLLVDINRDELERAARLEAEARRVSRPADAATVEDRR
jgi:glycosyltransferase involved in cell wall biosynthesis